MEIRKEEEATGCRGLVAVFAFLLALAAGLLIYLRTDSGRRLQQRLLIFGGVMLQEQDHFSDQPVRKLVLLGKRELLTTLESRLHERFKITTSIQESQLPLFWEARVDALKAHSELAPLLRSEDEAVIAVIEGALFDPALPDLQSRSDNERRVGVISLRKLRSDNPASATLDDRIYKTTLRMLGSFMGFGRSVETRCLMSFAMSLEDLDRKGTEYCGKRDEYLREQGLLR